MARSSFVVRQVGLRAGPLEPVLTTRSTHRPTRSLSKLLGVISALILGWGQLAALADGLHEPWTETGTFVSAPDGDTLKIRTARRGLVTVRVAGIDTPEHGQDYWRVARAHLIAFTTASDVTVACYKTDQYHREICRVQTSAGDLAASLVGAGLAWHYKRFQDEQTPEERSLYANLEQRARERRIGLWQEPDPMPPDVCRKVRRDGEKCH